MPQNKISKGAAFLLCVTTTYNDANMVTAMGTEVDGTAVTGFEYLYKTDGNQYRKTDTVNGIVNDYEYDLAGQLTYEKRAYTTGTTAPSIDRYWYDARGNRTLKNEYRPDPEQLNQQLSTFKRSSYNTANQLIESYDSETDTETAYTYDELGNLLTDGSKTYTYNIRGQQTTTTDGTASASYTYYYDGLRKSKATNGVTTYFIWHNGNMVYEFTSTDDNSYAYGLRLISSDDYTYVLNAHGDVVALLDASGNVTKRYEYGAFGNELNPDSNDTNPFRYCGEYFDKETGTVYLRARYYSPVNGRFTTVDPIKDGLNWYVYCGNSPVMFVDPSGKYYVIKSDDGYELVRDTWYYSILRGITSWIPFFGEASIVVVEDGSGVVAGSSVTDYNVYNASNEYVADSVAEYFGKGKAMFGIDLVLQSVETIGDIDNAAFEGIVFNFFERNNISTTDTSISALTNKMDAALKYVKDNGVYFFGVVYNGMSLYDIDKTATSSRKGYNKMLEMLTGAYYYGGYYNINDAELSANNVLIYSDDRLSYIEGKILEAVK